MACISRLSLFLSYQSCITTPTTDECISRCLYKLKTKEIHETELNKIRSEKKREKKSNKKSIVNFKIGDKVKIEGSSTVGVIDSIEKNKAVINYDTFTTQTNLSKLEFVK